MSNNKSRTTVVKVRKRNKSKILKHRIYRFGIFSVIFVFAFLLLTAIVGAIITFTLNSGTRTDKSDYSLKMILPESAEKDTIEFSPDEIYMNSGVCIPISSLLELTDVTTKKNGNTVGIIFSESGEYADFIIGTRKCYVNGISNEIELTTHPKFTNNTLYVPIDFFENHVLGFTVNHNKENKTYTLSRNPDESPSFILKKPATSLSLSESSSSSTSSSTDFKLDLSVYEKYMNPSNRDEYLFLVSTSHPLDENYIPTDLIGTIYTRNDGRNTQKLREYACYALEAFLKEAEACGIDDVTVTSGYRSYEYQSQLFQNEINITGSAEEAAKSVNPPGSSEHQSGLCVDMHNLPAASTAFGGTKAAVWLEENAHKFGYILRYPKNKTTITGIGYEPWHFRFVGRYHATKMYELGMCLEEYMEYVNK